MKCSAGIVLIFCLLAVAVFTAGCAKMPKDVTDGISSSIDEYDSSGASATQQAVVFSTPVPTETPTSKPSFSKPPDDADPEANYRSVYDATTRFAYNVIPFDYKLKYPPMVFYYSAEVDTVVDKKAGTSGFGSKDDFSVEYEAPNPLAFYKVTIYNKETGDVIYTHDVASFAKKSESGKFKIYEAGDYHIEITGNMAEVKTRVLVPPDNF